MTWWDFLSDIVLIFRDILDIALFSAQTNDGQVVNITLGGLLTGVLVLGAILFYFIPRR